MADERPSCSKTIPDSSNQIEDAVKATENQIQEILKHIVSLSKAANELPKLGEGFELYSSFPAVSRLLQLEMKRLNDIAAKMLRFGGVKINIGEEGIDSDEQQDRLIDANDCLLERIGMSLDEAEGIRKQQEPALIVAEQRKSAIITTSWNRNFTRSSFASSQKQSDQDRNIQTATVRLLAARNVCRPQLKFMDKIDNSNSPFVPKLKEKHNAKQVWKGNKNSGNIRMFVDGEEQHRTAKLEPDLADQERAVHPYQYELDHFEPLEAYLKPMSNVPKPKLIDSVPLELIKTPEQLAQLCKVLKQQKEFAVDVEHHSYRSFQGLVCLIQISTHDADYIVDPFDMWSSMHLLNDPFSDPNIVKVLHGADRDIEWLQRDFGVYVVNLFDTGQAMRALHLPKFGLGFLVKYYLDVDLNKEFQLADWRIRPLPQELVKYAREDTHYLLYCFHCLRNQLIEMGNEQTNLLRSVFDRSRDICLKVYEKPLYNPDADFLVLQKSHKKTLNNRQVAALRQLYAWRDKVARAEDESLAFVLPNHMLLQIAEILPREMQGVLACCNPVPLMVKQELHELHRIITQARELPLVHKPTETKAVEFAKRDLNPLLYCPHDFSHTQDDEELIPSFDHQNKVTTALATTKKLGDSGTVCVKSRPDLFIFGEQDYPRSGITDNACCSNDAVMEEEIDGADEWISPFELYQLAKQREEQAIQRIRSEKMETEEVLEANASTVTISSVDETIVNDVSVVKAEDVMEEVMVEEQNEPAARLRNIYLDSDVVVPMRATRRTKQRSSRRERERMRKARKTGEFISTKPDVLLDYRINADGGVERIDEPKTKRSKTLNSSESLIADEKPKKNRAARKAAVGDSNKSSLVASTPMTANTNIDLLNQPFDYAAAKKQLFGKNTDKSSMRKRKHFDPSSQQLSQAGKQGKDQRSHVKRREMRHKKTITYTV